MLVSTAALAARQMPHCLLKSVFRVLKQALTDCLSVQTSTAMLMSSAALPNWTRPPPGGGRGEGEARQRGSGSAGESKCGGATREGRATGGEAGVKGEEVLNLLALLVQKYKY